MRQKMFPKLKIIAIFYKNVVAYNLVFTAICIPWYFYVGVEAILPMFWIKFFGFIFVGYLFYTFNAKSLYFYYNFGFTLRTLLIVAIIIESISYIVLISVGLYFVKI